MRAIRAYEPALCCSTWVCGPEVDQALTIFSADLRHLKDLGADTERHNLANDPGAFVGNDVVRGHLQVAGSAGAVELGLAPSSEACCAPGGYC